MSRKMEEKNSSSNSVKYLLSTQLRLKESLNALISKSGMEKEKKQDPYFGPSLAYWFI